jgi:Right handed beta helix region
MKNNSFSVVIICLASFAVSAHAKSKTINLPAGSVNALGAAIASVGSGGKVIVKSGVHTESATVNIAKPVSISGEPGAVIENNIAPSVNYPLPIVPLLDIKNTRGVTVREIWFRPSAGGTANCTVVIENSRGVQFVGNKITDFQFGVILQHADFAKIDNNDMDLTDRWMLDPNDPNFLPESDGIEVINGRFVQITNNHVVCATFGIFASDKFGLILGNTVSMSYVGIQMCHLPPDPVFYTINGGTVSSDTPATNWSAIGNNVTSSAWGYQVIDGANHNALLNNAASNNSPYDVEFAGDSYRYGFFTPTSSNNLFVAGSQTGLVVKDCGSNDKIIGNVQLVDHNADPCY